MFTTGPALRDFVLKDEERVTHVSPAYMRAHFSYQAHLEAKVAALSLPLMVVLAKRDAIIDNLRTRGLFEALPSARCRLVEYDAPHGIQFECAEELEASTVSFIHES